MEVMKNDLDLYASKQRDQQDRTSYQQLPLFFGLTLQFLGKLGYDNLKFSWSVN